MKSSLKQLSLAAASLIALTFSAVSVNANEPGKESEWLQHLTSAHIAQSAKPFQTRTETYYGFNEQWQALNRQEGSLSLTKGDLKRLMNKLGKTTRRVKEDLMSLNYEAEIAKEGLQLRMYYHF